MRDYIHNIVAKSIELNKKINNKKDFVPKISISTTLDDIDENLTSLSNQIDTKIYEFLSDIYVFREEDIEPYDINLKFYTDIAECVIYDGDINNTSTDDETKKLFKKFRDVYIYFNKNKEVQNRILISKNFLKETYDPNFQMFEGLKEPSVRYDVQPDIWEKEFFEYLETLLNIVLGDMKSFTKSFLKYRKFWLACFTAKIEDLNQDSNYEAVEAAGDATMKYALVNFIMRKEKNFNESMVTNIVRNYNSTGFQSLMAQEMKLINWARINTKYATEKIGEDILEAFIGTIDLILINIDKDVPKIGIGAKVAFNLYDTMFRNTKLDFSDAPKNVFRQRLEKLVPKELVTNFERSEVSGTPGNLEMCIYLGKELVSKLRSTVSKYGIDIPNVKGDLLIAKKKGRTKKVLSASAYVLATENIEKMGITEEFMEKFEYEMFYTPTYNEFVESVRKNYGEMFDYSGIWLVLVGKFSTGKDMSVLVGKRMSDGRYVKLVEMEKWDPKTPKDKKIDLLYQKYIAEHN